MSLRITGLEPAPFSHLFGLADEALAALGARRHVADRTPGFPDRVAMRDADRGESLLLNDTHQPANCYRASHAIFVREGAGRRHDRTGEVPQVLRRRLISLRAFDASDEMVDAEVGEGRALDLLIGRMLADPSVLYLHAHYAKRGCYAGRTERAGSQARAREHGWNCRVGWDMVFWMVLTGSEIRHDPEDPVSCGDRLRRCQCGLGPSVQRCHDNLLFGSRADRMGRQHGAYVLGRKDQLRKDDQVLQEGQFILLGSQDKAGHREVVAKKRAHVRTGVLSRVLQEIRAAILLARRHMPGRG